MALSELLHRKYDLEKGGDAKVIECDYFTMTLHNIDGKKELDRSVLDSFVIYIALNGAARIIADGQEETIEEGEVILIPAECGDITIEGSAKLMEVYIDK